MTLLAKQSIKKEDKSNIITLGAIAKEEKKKDNNVVNATIGMLYDEAGKLFTFKSVNKALGMLSDDEKYAYASTPGSKDFHEALKKWVFRQYYDEFKDISAVMATAGGTGALSNSLSNYLNYDDKVLLPNYMWGNYKQIAYEANVSFDTYNLFNDEGNFDIESLKSKMIEMKKSQGRIVFIINDPCHNPTGYIMKDSEWDLVIELMNKMSEDGTPVILIHDMAYLDFDSRGFDRTRANIRKYQKLNDSAAVIMAFSGSKSFALYGIRIGAQIFVSKNREYINEFNSANKFSSRSKWSNSTNLGINLITKILNNNDLKLEFEKELIDSMNLLSKRAKIFLDESNKVGLKTLPFTCGFFITIPANNPDLAYKYLVEKKIHVIPMGNVLRVTISAINLKECKMLPKYIMEAITKTN